MLAVNNSATKTLGLILGAYESPIHGLSYAVITERYFQGDLSVLLVLSTNISREREPWRYMTCVYHMDTCGLCDRCPCLWCFFRGIKLINYRPRFSSQEEKGDTLMNTQSIPC